MFKDCCQKVNMHLCLQTSVGPVKFPDTDCYIVQEASWEMLIEKSLKDYWINQLSFGWTTCCCLQAMRSFFSRCFEFCENVQIEGQL